ncbi:hypothetical protein BTE77_15430 [Ensifer adhaerens]|nr:hypothetical protein BTE77_15430 [Ensifer adhaerens]
MNEQSAKVVGKQVAANEEAPAAKGKAEIKQGRSRFRPLSAEHMPRDYSISLDAYRRGGTDAFIGRSPDHLVKQRLTGFEPQYANIIDYIIRITHQIWEEKDIGYIYDTYSHDCLVWDDLALQVGRDKIVADTTSLNNAFPDIRIVAEDVVWAGDDAIGFHTSHRSQIIGTNTGFSRYGAPTGRRVQFLCMANCVARDNEIFYEHVVYDTAEVVKQLGLCGRDRQACCLGRRECRPSARFPRRRAEAHRWPGQAGEGGDPDGNSRQPGGIRPRCTPDDVEPAKPRCARSGLSSRHRLAADRQPHFPGSRAVALLHAVAARDVPRCPLLGR